MRRITIPFLLLFNVLPAAYSQVDPDLLSGMKARSIGPAAMSGRVAAIDGVMSNPDILYVGAATGGVWKSADGGTSWTPIFDDQPVAAIGALAINQATPDIVWVGTGEGNVRNSVSVGNGIYKTVDGGKTWSHLGLDKTERIARIVLDPGNARVAYAAAMGQAWGENPDRGVFKTEDGGKSWRKVLYVDERTGAAELVIDPSNPNHLLAGMWDYRRWPWFFRSGGAGSGIYSSYDGGESWKRLTEEDGLPKGTLGRSAFAFSRSNPSTVYALVEAAKSAFLRSDDGGKSWKKVNDDPEIDPRPFYFSALRVDPRNPNRIYKLWTLVSLSEDGGKSWRVLVPFGKVHPDHHAMWIPADHPELIVDGNDGGVAISRDRGNTWRFVPNLPLGQYYHINVDFDRPYHVYGGMQDNGSWRGPSSVWETGAILSSHWQEVAFGDGFATLALATDPTVGYSMSQEGYLYRWDVKTGERKDIRPPFPDGTTLRFNWNSGIAADPFDGNTVYYGSQFLHRSTDRGDNWTIISPDLTTNNKEWQNQARSGGITTDASGAENFTTIISVAPSAVTKGVLWTGTDDGRIHVTRDGGATWTSVEANIKGVPKNSWIPHIEPSKFNASTAFVAFDNHRRSDWTPYVFRTDDFGKSWTSLATSSIRGYALDLEQDPVDSNLLFLGTEFGLFVSLDGGKGWMQWKHGLPTVSTIALMVHPREHDLVIGTHGRAGYIIDDIRPLRSITAATMAEPIHLFEIPAAQQYRAQRTPGARFSGATEFRGENRPYGALITYSLNASGLPLPVEEKERARKEKERAGKPKPEEITAAGIPQQLLDVPRAGEKPAPKELATNNPPKTGDEKGPQAEIKIFDASGKKIRTFKAPATLGVNRAAWDLRADPFKDPPKPKEEGDDNEPTGPEVVPGSYMVSVSYGGHESRQPLQVSGDPRFTVADNDRLAHWATVNRAGKVHETIARAVERIQRTRTDIEALVARSKTRTEDKKEGKSTTDAPAADDPLTTAGKTLTERLDSIEKRLWIPPKTPGLRREDDPWSVLSYVESALDGEFGAPTSAQLTYLSNVEKKVTGVLDDLNQAMTTDVINFRNEVRKSGIDLLSDTTPLTLEASPKN
ncbi:MAG TPA: hypothetical protein VHL58_07915 [Thermoanaerobaculia bacterium]|nr:hypothetical protein [Thermoanaerobaculia bacterium]